MRRSAALLLVLAAGCGGSAHPQRTLLHHGDGVTYRVPASWHVAPRSLTPHLANPRELFTAGTGRLAASGGRCAHLPSAALAAMSAADVLVTVQERFGSDSDFRPRPHRFGLDGPSISEASACAGPHHAFASYWFGFRDRGRGFHVLVAVGRSAPRARVHEALAILDSLRIQARKPVRMNPDFSIPEHEAAAGIDFVHPDSWRLYRQSLTQLGEPGQRLALGTFQLHQHGPDPNCTPATALRERPPGGGFLFLYETQELNHSELARLPPRTARLRLSGPRPYECFGSSWRVDFRDGGRAFTAHVYGPLRRRREALAILDSLRIRPAPFVARLGAARLPARPGWRTRVSGPQREGGCLQRRAHVVGVDRPVQRRRLLAAAPPDDRCAAAGRDHHGRGAVARVPRAARHTRADAPIGTRPRRADAVPRAAPRRACALPGAGALPRPLLPRPLGLLWPPRPDRSAARRRATRAFRRSLAGLAVKAF